MCVGLCVVVCHVFVTTSVCLFCDDLCKFKQERGVTSLVQVCCLSEHVFSVLAHVLNVTENLIFV